MHPSIWQRTRRWIALATLVLGGLLLWPAFVSTNPTTTSRDVEGAWQYAHKAGRYEFQTQMVQISHPSSTIANIGSQSKTHRLSIEGSADRAEESLNLILRGYPMARRYVEIRIADGKSMGRQSATQAWQPLDVDTQMYAPGGDPLAFLRAVERIEQVGVDSEADASAHYRFSISGPVYAALMREQLEAALRQNGTLPPSLNLDVPDIYLNMQASGELWLNAAGLPVRQEIRISFPLERGATEWYEATISTTFANWEAPLDVTLAQAWSNPRLLAYSIGITRAELQDAGFSLALLVLLALLALLALRYRQSPRLQTVVASLLIAAMLLTPLMQADQALAYTAKTQPSEPDPERAPAFDPQRNPLAAASAAPGQVPGTRQMAVASSVSNDPNCDNSYDDGDGLAAAVECYELGTDPADADTDHDNISDGTEVAGIKPSTSTTIWYLNPLNPDSNGDNISDGLECPNLVNISSSGSVTTALGTTCTDTDGDTVPDIYDYDNDSDGVPDLSDSAPNTYMGSLTTGLTDDRFTFNVVLTSTASIKSMYVDFELRPVDEDLLWQNGNVLDWAHADTEGQITRNSDTTFYEYGGGATAYSDSSNIDDGNVMIVPMIEIMLTYSSANPSAGLPIASGYSAASITGFSDLDWIDADALEEYGISYKQGDETGTTLYLYVPVSTMEDTVGDTPVGLIGRMYYEPATTNSGATQQVRLAWLVEALTDSCDTTDMPDSFAHPTETGTTVSSGDDDAYDLWCDYADNWDTSEEIIQTYYEDFYVTGMTVKENHGLKMAVYSQSNTTSSYENKLWALAERAAANFTDGDLKSTGVRLGAHDIDSYLSAWGIGSSGLTVNEYTFNDQIAMASMITSGNKTNLAQSHPSPTAGQMANLLYISEETSRSMGLEAATVGSSSISMPVSSEATYTTGGVRWAPFVYNNGAWDDQDLSTFAVDLGIDLIDTFTSGNLSTLVDGETINDSSLARNGAILLAQHYYAGMYAGSYGVVARNGASFSSVTMSTTSQTTEAAVAIVAALLDEISGYYSDLTMVQELDDDLSASTDSAQLAASLTTLLETFGDIAAGDTVSSLTALLQQLTTYANTVDSSTSSGTTSSLINAIIAVGVYSQSIAVTFDHDTTTSVLWNSSVNDRFAYSWLAFTASDATVDISIGLAKAGKSVYNMYGVLTQVGAASNLSNAMTAGGFIFSVALILGPFVMAIVSGSIQPGTMQFSAALAQVIADLVVVILFLILSSTGVGAIVVLIIKLLDGLMGLICGITNIDRDKAVDEWFCDGISGILGNILAYVILDATIIPDLENDDRLDISFDSIGIDADTGVDGFVAGNTLAVTMTVQSTLYPNLNQGLGTTYFWQFVDALDDTKAAYKLQTSETDFDPETVSWTGTDYVIDTTSFKIYNHEFTASGSAALPTTAGINQSLTMYLGESLRADVQECWMNVVCVIRNGQFETTSHVDLSEDLVFDILPTTLSAFLALTSVGSNSYRMALDSSFPTLVDGDGDGLASQATGGSDPNDSKADSDGDGLSDYWEYANGSDPEDSNADDDGLYDYWEALYGSDPNDSDTDGDGLLDGEEVFHPVAISAYDTSTTAWSGGWTFAYAYSGSTALATKVTADPLNADSDDDDISDTYEKIYGYNPNVASDLKVLSLSSSIETPHSLAGYVAPGDLVKYTATVTNELALRTAQGLLEVELPTDTTQTTKALSTLLPQASVTTSGSVTVNAAISATTVQTLTVRAGATISDLDYPVFELTMDGSYADSSIYSHTPTCSGTACPTTNSLGTNMGFDGGDSLTMAADDDFDLTSFTIEAMFSRKSSTNAPTLIKKGTTGFNVGVDSSGKPYAKIYLSNCTTAATAYATGGINDLGTHTVVATYSGALLALYVDGSLVASTAAASICTNSSAISIGASLNGAIEELTLYSTAWAADQVEGADDAALFTVSSKSGGDDADAFCELYYWWYPGAFGDEAQAQCVDATTGVRGDGIKLDGNEGSYVRLSSSSDPVATDNTFSFGLWMYPEDRAFASGASTAKPAQQVLSMEVYGYDQMAPGLYVRDKNVMVRFGHEAMDGTYCQAETSNSPLTYSTWQHVVATYDNTAFKLYVNGALVSSSSSWTTNGKCYGYDVFQISEHPEYTLYSSTGGWDYLLGWGLTKSIYFNQLTTSTIASDGDGGGHEPYIYTNGTQDGAAAQIWYAGANAVHAGGTNTIHEWATVYNTLNFFLCEPDDDNTTTCSGSKYAKLIDKSHKSSDISSSIYRSNYSATDSFTCSSVNSSVCGGFNGSLSYTVYNTGFQGKLDEVQIYKNALDATEVTDLYNTYLYGARLTFDEATGQSSFSDSSGNAVSVTCSSTGGTCPESGLAGRNNQAVSFDGVNDKLTLGADTDALNIYDHSFTVSAWVKGAGSTFTTGDQAILSVNTDSTGTLRKGLHVVLRSGKPYFAFWNTDTSSATTLSANTWYHLAFVYDKTALTQKIYINGVLNATGTSKSAYNGTDQTLYVGYSYVSDKAFSGTIDDLVIASEALSASQIQSLMAESPVLNLAMDEDYPATTFASSDQSGYSATCSGTRCPQAGAAGQMREAAVFDGADKLSITPGTTLNLSTYSLGMWVKPTKTRSVDQYLIRKYSGSAQNFNLLIKPNSLQLFYSFTNCAATGYYYTASSGSLTEDQWNYVMVTTDGTTLSIYINGALDTSSTLTSAATPCTTASTMELGTDLAGSLDEVTVYGSVLDSDAIAAIYAYQVAWYDVTEQHVITVDVDQPTVSLDAAGTTQTVDADGDLLLGITAADPTTIIASVQYRVNSGAWISAAATEGDPWTLTLTPASSGSYSIDLRATDSVGNQGTASGTIGVDLSAPAMTLSGTLTSAVLAVDDSIALSGTVADSGASASGLDTGSVSVDLLDWQGISLSNAQAASVSGSAWSASYPLGIKADSPLYGTYSVEGSAADLAGNVSAGPLDTIELDSEGPAADLVAAATIFSTTGTILRGTVSDVPYESSGKMLHLHFEEAGDASAFNDGSANHLQATCTGSACPTAGQSGKFGSALSFDGSGDYVRVANDKVLETSDGTLMAWIKPTWTSGANGFNPTIMALRDGTETRYSWHISDDYTHMVVWNGSSQESVAMSIIPNQWNHVALVMSAGTWTGYLNGVPMGSKAQAFSTIAGRPLNIGSIDGNTDFFKGMMDEVVIYNQALSDDEIHAIANPLSTTVASAALRFRHAADRDQATGAGIWHPLTLDTAASTATTWQYALNDALEGPYKIDLKATDALGNSRYVLGAWEGLIDTRAPRVALSYTQLSASTAQVSCTASDFDLTASGWDCPVAAAYRTASYVDDTWYSDIFSPTQQLERLTTSTQAVTATSGTLTACDSVGHCTTLSSAAKAAPGGVTGNLHFWVKAAAGTSSSTAGAAVSAWADQSGNLGNAAQSAAARQPTYQSAVFNHNPALRFDGSNDYLSTTMTLNPQSTSHTLWVVASPDLTHGGRLFQQEDSGGTGRGILYYENDGYYHNFWGGSDHRYTAYGSGRPTLTSLAAASGQSITFYENGLSVRTDTATIESTSGKWLIGIHKDLTSYPLDGDVAEMIVYDTQVTTARRAMIDSYMALKYGITLNVAQPYVDSSGNTLWNGSALSGYHNQVAGIGRDDLSGLAQFKSRSSAGDLVTVAVGASLTAPTAFDDNQTFMIWGNNAVSAALTSTSTIDSVKVAHLRRTWRVQTVGDVGTVSVAFDLSGLGLTYDSNQVALLIDDDGDFSDATLHSTGRSISGSVISFNNVTFRPGQYFTLVTDSAYGTVAESINYTLVYAISIPTNADYNSGTPAYSVNNAASIGTFDRVAYYMELTSAAGATTWAYVSMPAFTTSAAKIGVPVAATGATFEQTVSNINVYSNVSGVTTGDGIATGNLEFWHNCYDAPANSSLSGSSSSLDFDDTKNTSSSCYGSMQIHNYGAAQTIMAWNRWDYASGYDDVGIGNRATSYPDYTFAQNANSYTSRKLYVLARKTGAGSLMQPTQAGATEIQPSPVAVSSPAMAPASDQPQRSVAQLPARALSVDVAVLANGQPISPSTTLDRQANPDLTATWTTLGGAAPVSGYTVTWYSYDANGMGRIVQSASLPDSATSNVYAAGEAERLAVEVRAVTGADETASQRFEPIYVDYFTTPAYIPAAGDLYNGWMQTACNQLGVDTRLSNRTSAASSHDAAQRFAATWSATDLHLAWQGTDWRHEGDLFIYLDTVAGGSPSAYNPYSATITTTAILLPLNPENRQPMGADYLVWVREDGTTGARLLRWDGPTQSWLDAAGAWTYTFRPDLSAAQADMVLPFASIGIDNPNTQPLSMVALASDDEALNVWSSMPIYNNLNSAEVVGTQVRDDVQVFALLRAYRWPNLAPATCPSGVDDGGQRWGPRANFNGAVVSGAVRSTPGGVVYGLFRNNLIFAHQQLLPDQADWSGALAPLCQGQPGGPPPPPECVRAPDDDTRPNQADISHRTQLARIIGVEQTTVGQGQTIEYSMDVSNSGDRRAEHVKVEISTPGLLRLPGGQIVVPPTGDTMYQQIIELGTLQPGEVRTLNFQAVVDITFNPVTNPDWVHLRAIVIDETGGGGDPNEDLHIDHELDLTAPDYVEVQSPSSVIGAGRQTIAGFVADQSDVPTLILELGGQQTTCTDPTPADGQWSCSVDLGTRSDGAQIPVQIKAIDRLGHASGWFAGPTLVIDTVAPVLTLGPASAADFSDNLIGLQETLISGPITDNRSVQQVEVCESAAADARCTATAIALDPATIAQTTRVYTDIPATPLSFGATTACGGAELVRTFSINDQVSVADLDVGLLIEHPFRNDVVVWLESPAGTRAELVSRGASADNLNVRLSDATRRSVYLEDDLENHSLSGGARQERRPFMGSLASFNGQSAQGVWKLTICDHYPASDDGRYIQSELIIRSATAPGAVSGAWSYDLALEKQASYAQSLVIYGYDASGNRSAGLSLSAQVDTIKPQIGAITLPLSPTQFFVLSGNITDEHSVEVQLYVRNAAGRLQIAPAPNTNGAWSFSNTDLFTPDALNCVWVRTEDQAANMEMTGPLGVYAAWVPATQARHPIYLPLLLVNAGSAAAVNPSASSSRPQRSFSQSSPARLLLRLANSSDC